MAKTRDREAARFERTEERLRDWADACNSNAGAGGLPQYLTATITHIRAETKKSNERNNAIKREIRKARRKWQAGDPPIDPKAIAQSLGYADFEPEVIGKQTRVSHSPSLTLGTRELEVDEIVSRLPKWMRKCIMRSYLYGQPDRKAAYDMRMRAGEYAQRKRAAVDRVADELDRRYIQRRTCREV